MIKQARRLVLFCLDCLFPVECLSCGRSGYWLCLECRPQLLGEAEQQCPICRLEHVGGRVHKTCFSYLDAVLVMGEYGGLLKRAIRAFKYHFAYEIGSELGVILNSFLTTQSLSVDLVVPVPVTKKRLLWRGFNQSTILATALVSGQSTKLSYDLVKLRDTVPQAQLAWSERLFLNMDNFSWQGQSLTGLRVLVVDDVMTTGRTLESVAEALKRAGAEQVLAVVLARGH